MSKLKTKSKIVKAVVTVQSAKWMFWRMLRTTEGGRPYNGKHGFFGRDDRPRSSAVSLKTAIYTVNCNVRRPCLGPSFLPKFVESPKLILFLCKNGLKSSFQYPGFSTFVRQHSVFTCCSNNFAYPLPHSYITTFVSTPNGIIIADLTLSPLIFSINCRIDVILS